MVRAKFTRKKFRNVICLLCGSFLIGLFVFLGYTDSAATAEDTLTGVILGTFFCVLGIIFLLFNFKAYLYVDTDNGRIKGKYHYFGKLDCAVKDVDFVLSQFTTLTILQKNGKRYVITGIENAAELGLIIRRCSFKLESKPCEDTYLELKNVQAIRKKLLCFVIGGIILMFINIFIGVLLTGGREISDFVKLDWILFFVMCAVEVPTVIATFYYACKCGKLLLNIEHLKYRLKGANIALQPLPSGNPRLVYTDQNYTGRIIVYALPENGGAYYCRQEFSESEFRLDTVFTSEIYESVDVLAEAMNTLIDITENFR